MQAASTGLKKAKREEILHAVDYVRWINLARPAGQGQSAACASPKPRPRACAVKYRFSGRVEVSAFATVVPHVSGLITRDRPLSTPRH